MFLNEIATGKANTKKKSNPFVLNKAGPKCGITAANLILLLLQIQFCFYCTLFLGKFSGFYSVKLKNSTDPFGLNKAG